MNITINREALLPSLQQVIGAVERKQTSPILGNVLIKSDNGTISLTATDMEIELVARLDVSVNETFATTLPARKLLDICKALPESADINMQIEENQVQLKSSKSRFTLSSLPASDFPVIDEIKASTEFSLAQKQLKLLIEKTAFAMAQQDVRYYLNGMLIELHKSGIRLVATDGHRLALSEHEAELQMSSDKQIIVPRKGIMELSRLLENSDDTTSIALSQNHIRVSMNNLVFTSKLIDGKFPDYNRVIPLDSDKVLSVNRDLLKHSLYRISILSNEKYRGIRLTLDKNNLMIQANNPDQEEAEEEITVDYDETPIEIGFNVTYLLDVLSVLDSDDVNIKLKDSNSSCVITSSVSESFRYVVMPMRL